MRFAVLVIVLLLPIVAGAQTDGGGADSGVVDAGAVSDSKAPLPAGSGDRDTGLIDGGCSSVGGLPLVLLAVLVVAGRRTDRR